VSEIQAMADALLNAGFQRAEAERTLRDREQRLGAIIDHNIAGIAQLDLTGRFTLVNDRLCEMVGRPREEVLISRLDQFTHPENAADEERLLTDLIESGRSQTREVRLLRPDGTAVWASVSMSSIREVGLPTVAILVALDVTDRRRAEAERSELLEREQRARADAERANRAKDEFLATLSHELRTPLNALRLWAGVLRQRPLDQDTLARGIDTIDRNAALQAQLIDDLLDISRIASGKLRLEMGPIEPQAVIESAVETVRAAAEGKHLTLARALDRDVGPVLGDATRLQQVMWNLLSNALKFTPVGGRIDVRLRRRGAGAEVTVQDTGQGIAPELLPHIFDRFRQGDSSPTRPQGGLGLGLAIARQLVELHGGSIRAESPGEGRGTTFTVTLPLTADTRAWSRGPTVLELAAPGGEVLRDLAVLVVDDDADAREALSMSLARTGARVSTAASVAEAMAEAARQWPAVLVSDIGMPGEDGISLIGRVRRLEAAGGGRIRAVALTAYAGEDDRRRIIEAGYDLHVPKPVSTGNLIALLVRLLADGGRRAVRPT
jgi:PAS domain S-box-containing protein